jgi:hypothetical protein
VLIGFRLFGTATPLIVFGVICLLALIGLDYLVWVREN